MAAGRRPAWEVRTGPVGRLQAWANTRANWLGAHALAAGRGGFRALTEAPDSVLIRPHMHEDFSDLVSMWERITTRYAERPLFGEKRASGWAWKTNWRRSG